MESRSLVALLIGGSLLVALLSWLATPPALPTPGPASGPVALAPSEPAASPEASPAPALDPSVKPSPATPRVDAEEPASGGLDPLRQGSVLRPDDEVMIGLSGFPRVRRGGSTTQLAWFSVGVRPVTYAVEIGVGERLRAGGHELEVLEIDPEARLVRYRWTKVPSGEAFVQPAGAGGDRLRLSEMGLYRLADGRVIGVGNVIATDEGGAVSLTVFSAGYAKDPMAGYENHVRVRAGEPLESATTKVLQVRVGTGSRGWVELAL